ncbi:hypothetical protein PV326_002471, partial [Microctonus aethiopoides]
MRVTARDLTVSAAISGDRLRSLWPHSCETATSSTNNTTLPGVFHEMLQNVESYATNIYDSVQEWLHPPNILTTEDTLSNGEMMQ